MVKKFEVLLLIRVLIRLSRSYLKVIQCSNLIEGSLLRVKDGTGGGESGIG